MRTLAPRPRRARRGFSLLEILIVMIVLGVVSATSMGKMHTIMTQQRLYRAATATQGDLEAAFAISVRNRAPIRISWDATNLQVDVTDRAGTTIYRKSNLGAEYGIAAADVSFSRSPVEVYPNGIADGTLTITLTLEHMTRTVQMSRTGLIQTQ